ncbi:probable protein phosphatase 2C 11 [Anneissia japonica]|uniref:probable protein phosphatase 2C 11 n=1 Tax=Anneissia japonica TaxID=1529436 RepID=UPI0014259849|nr:probable protein phosphatase 2C 11 [Anneissia japonica]
MGAYLSEPNLVKTSEEGKTERFTFGVSSMQGWRLAQEDSHNCIEELDENTSLFGVYDGHGGAEVAQYCSQHLPEFIKQNKSYKEGDVEKGLISAFLEFDKHLTEKKVITELKKMAGLEDPEEEDDEETELLNEEASMPIADLLARFGQAPSSIRSIRKKADKKDLLSPMIRKTQPRFPSNGSNEPDIEEESEEKEGEKNIKNDKISAKLEMDDSDVPKEQNGKGDGNVNGDVIENGDIKETEEDEETKDDSNNEVTNNEENQQTSSSSSDIKNTERRDVVLDDVDSEDDDEEEYDAEEDEEDDDDEEEEDEDEEDEEEDEEEKEVSGSNVEDYGFPGREEPGSDSGCTAVVAILRDNELVVANAGDSRCVLSRGSNALDLSLDHKPEDDEELERIVYAGGKVTEDGRVNGGLNLSRALGDHCYKQNKSLALEKQMISPLPDIRKVTLQAEDSFFILACDGIWNVLSSQEVVDFVSERLNQDHPEGGTWTLTAIIEELFDACLAPDTSGDGTGCDNMTCIIVQLNHDNTVTIASKKRKVSESEDSDCKRVCKE